MPLAREALACVHPAMRRNSLRSCICFHLSAITLSQKRRSDTRSQHEDFLQVSVTIAEVSGEHYYNFLGAVLRALSRSRLTKKARSVTGCFPAILRAALSSLVTLVWQ